MISRAQLSYDIDEDQIEIHHRLLILQTGQKVKIIQASLSKSARSNRSSTSSIDELQDEMH